MQTAVKTSIDGMDEAAAIVRFYDGKVHMNEKDRQEAIVEGRMTPEQPDYGVVPFVKIQFPGRNDLVVERPAYLEGGGDFVPDNVRYPAAWHAYQDKTVEVAGTSLDVLTSLNEGDIAHLVDKGIRTVELLENLSDTQLIALGMGMRRYRDIARAWREKQPVANAAAQAEVNTLRAELDAMREQVQALLATQPKRRARADKEETHGDDA